jgi:dihydroorotase (multifunctional complex type)
LIIDSVLTNAKVMIKGEVLECCFAIEEGNILKIGKETHMPQADQKIDLHHMLVLPGVIDLHVHLRDEEKSYKETFITGTASASAGGVTTVLDMPNNSPVTMSQETLRNRMEIASTRVLTNVGFYSELPTNINEIEPIVSEGALGFKLFMAEQVGGQNVDDDESLLEVFKRVGELDTTIAFHAEDHKLLEERVEKFKLEHRDDIAAFLKAHDENVELAAVERIINLATRSEKTHLHFCHLSTQKALNAIDEARKSSKNLTCEVTPHHLLLTKDYYKTHYGLQALTMPPLRTKENADALLAGIIENKIDTIGSDHAPHTSQEKEARSVWDVKAGIPGLESTLPLILTMVHQNKLTLIRAIELLSEKPAEIFHIKERGQLEQGKKADLAVVDFNQKYRLDASKFKSKAKTSPFDKWDVQGKPLKTFVNGQLVMDEGEIVAKPGSGSILRREKT